ncbi:MAG: hypothetical protein ACYDAI_13230 [Trichloromonadaceae bacterium]
MNPTVRTILLAIPCSCLTLGSALATGKANWLPAPAHPYCGFELKKNAPGSAPGAFFFDCRWSER